MQLAQIVEMARPKKICKDCGKSMAGHHYWYKGGWKCKKANRKGDEPECEKVDKKPAAKAKKEDKKSAKKEAPATRPSDDEDEKEHKGVVRGLEREAGEDKDEDVTAAEAAAKKGKKRQAGEAIAADEMKDIDADSEGAARKQINNLFPKASSEQKARALNVWKATHKKKASEDEEGSRKKRFDTSHEDAEAEARAAGLSRREVEDIRDSVRSGEIKRIDISKEISRRKNKKTNESVLTESTTSSGREVARSLGQEIAGDFAQYVRAMWRKEGRNSGADSFGELLATMATEESWREQVFGEYTKVAERAFDSQMKFIEQQDKLRTREK